MPYSSLVFGWKIPGDEFVDKFDELRFPLQFYYTPDADALYFAFEYKPEKNEEIGYGGFQPVYKEGNEDHYFKYIFSSFMSDIRDFNPEYCHLGADGGDGCTCRVVKPGALGTWYSLRVRVEENDAKGLTYYTGSIVNEDTGITLVRVGYWAVDQNKGGLLNNSYLGFIEPYADNPINERHISDVVFGRPKGYRNGKEYIGDPIYKYRLDDDSLINYEIITNEDGTVRIKTSPKG